MTSWDRIMHSYLHSVLFCSTPLWFGLIGVGCYFEESENRDGESSVWRKKEREEWERRDDARAEDDGNIRYQIINSCAAQSRPCRPIHLLLHITAANHSPYSPYKHSNSGLGSPLEVVRETRARPEAGSRAFHATSPNGFRPLLCQ